MRGNNAQSVLADGAGGTEKNDSLFGGDGGHGLAGFRRGSRLEASGAYSR
jgi:hypothetical protein